VEHLLEWFQELAATRRVTVVAGLGGGAIFPAAISWPEIDAWSRVTARRPSPWEARLLREMDDAWLMAYNGNQSQPQKDQDLGDYCRGEKIEECRKQFGPGFLTVCRTCPN